ncbi:hypothetical protein M9Y10_020618 [Tritrichomonas musculus]|uniref:Uncharacterized protein n=1 Tax=Tritrichomonas musculus TaxID=1915356 RepID=A0ABR2HF78_9EUKA
MTRNSSSPSRISFLIKQTAQHVNENIPDDQKKLEELIKKLELEKKEYFKIYEHLRESNESVNKENQILKDTIDDRKAYYEQILDRYFQSNHFLETTIEHNRKMSKIYRSYKTRVRNFQKITKNEKFSNAEMEKFQRELDDIDERVNELMIKFPDSEKQVHQYQVQLSLISRLYKVNNLFSKEAERFVKSEPNSELLPISNHSAFDELEGEFNNGNELKKELCLYNYDESENQNATNHLAKQINRCLPIYNQLIKINKTKEMLVPNQDNKQENKTEDSTLDSTLDSTFILISSSLISPINSPKGNRQNFVQMILDVDFNEELFELKRIVKSKDFFDYLNDPKSEGLRNNMQNILNQAETPKKKGSSLPKLHRSHHSKSNKKDGSENPSKSIKIVISSDSDKLDKSNNDTKNNNDNSEKLIKLDKPRDLENSTKSPKDSEKTDNPNNKNNDIIDGLNKLINSTKDDQVKESDKSKKTAEDDGTNALDKLIKATNDDKSKESEKTAKSDKNNLSEKSVKSTKSDNSKRSNNNNLLDNLIKITNDDITRESERSAKSIKSGRIEPVDKSDKSDTLDKSKELNDNDITGNLSKLIRSSRESEKSIEKDDKNFFNAVKTDESDNPEGGATIDDTKQEKSDTSESSERLINLDNTSILDRLLKLENEGDGNDQNDNQLSTEKSYNSEQSANSDNSKRGEDDTREQADHPARSERTMASGDQANEKEEKGTQHVVEDIENLLFGHENKATQKNEESGVSDQSRAKDEHIQSEPTSHGADSKLNSHGADSKLNSQDADSKLNSHGTDRNQEDTDRQIKDAVGEVSNGEVNDKAVCDGVKYASVETNTDLRAQLIQQQKEIRERITAILESRKKDPTAIYPPFLPSSRKVPRRNVPAVKLAVTLKDIGLEGLDSATPDKAQELREKEKEQQKKKKDGRTKKQKY